MDKSDIALVVSGLSALGTAASVIYTRRMARNDTERMKRKAPVFEVTLRSSMDYPGWTEGIATIRNLEPMSACILELRSIRKGVLLLHASAAYETEETGIGVEVGYVGHGGGRDRVKLECLKVEEASSKLELRNALAPFGSDGGLPWSGSTQYVEFFMSENGSREDLTWDWEWLDGTKR